MTCPIELEHLSAYRLGDLPDAIAHDIAAHLGTCPACARSLQRLEALDRELDAWPVAEPSPEAMFSTQRKLSQLAAGEPEPEILTPFEAAAFLRVSLDELDDLVSELPAFEVAGKLRFRRSRLEEWIRQQESRYMRSNVESAVARSLSGPNKEGVA